jgi:hypothetical protein
MDMFFILGTLAQVVAHPKEKEKLPREPLDVLLLVHHLKRLARSSQERGPIHIMFESISGIRTSMQKNGRPGHIRTPFLMIHIWMER